jgi:adenylate cyclase
VTPGDLRAFECGEVGWVVDRPTFRLAGGQQFDTRITLVLHREDGTWRIVHSHASVGS